MKEKKLKKIADYIADSLSKPKKGYEEKELSINCNEETFVKFEKLVNHLLNYDVNIEIYSGSLTVHSDSYKRVKSSKSTIQNESERIEIHITKDYFSMNIGYQNRSKFKKEGVYEHFYEKFIKTLEKKILIT